MHILNAHFGKQIRLKSVTCLFRFLLWWPQFAFSCLLLKMGFRKCGAKVHGDSVPEKPNPPDLHQYRPETSLATGGIWEEKTLWPQPLPHPSTSSNTQEKKETVGQFFTFINTMGTGGNSPPPHAQTKLG